jgi:hypothetical protein
MFCDDLCQVLGFRTPEEVDAWLFDNPMRCPGALHFQDINATQIKYGIQTNSTPVARRGTYEDPTFKFQIPLQVAAEREMARLLIGGIASFVPLQGIYFFRALYNWSHAHLQLLLLVCTF